MGGFPVGAEATASLRKKSIVSKQQGQRLLALPDLPNPLFMLVVIGAGFIHKPIIGAIIAAAVWLSALWMMLLSTLLSPKEPYNTAPSPLSAEHKKKASLLYRAAEAPRHGREQDGRSFGKALGDAVSASVQKLMMIGGLMIFAAVLAKLSEPVLAPILAKSGLGFLVQALLEGHLGAYAAAVWDAPGTSSLSNAAAIAAVLAWSGVSGILQAGYSISGTDLKLLPFIAWRAIHAVHAALFIVLLWKPITSLLRPLLAPGATPTFATNETSNSTFGMFSAFSVRVSELPSIWQLSLPASAILAFIGIALALLLLPYRKAGNSV